MGQIAHGGDCAENDHFLDIRKSPCTGRATGRCSSEVLGELLFSKARLRSGLFLFRRSASTGGASVSHAKGGFDARPRVSVVFLSWRSHPISGLQRSFRSCDVIDAGLGVLGYIPFRYIGGYAKRVMVWRLLGLMGKMPARHSRGEYCEWRTTQEGCGIWAR
jgi:hypothetical protein